MKKAGAFVASVAAASSMALHPPLPAPSSSSDTDRCLFLTTGNHLQVPASPPPSAGKAGGGLGRNRGGAVVEDRFAPRFDGLRFIETLVTAHR